MTRYRKKPIEVDAICFTGGNFVAIRTWQNNFGDDPCFWSVAIDSPLIQQGIYAEVWDKLHATWVGVKPNDWIIRGIQGEYYPCDGDVFVNTYDPVEDAEVQAARVLEVLEQTVKAGILPEDEVRRRLTFAKPSE